MNRFKFLGVAVLAAALMFSMAALSLTACAAPPEEKDPLEMTATELVAKMKVGWNLGNTFDSPSETAWGNPMTTRENFNTLKKAGFNVIRIPVSWSSKIDGTGESAVIRANQLSRIKEVVDYAIAEDMFILLNTHHDTGLFRLGKGTRGEPITQLTAAEIEETKTVFRTIWQQIAVAFKDYDGRLIFEALNEPRTPNSPREWQGGTPEERAILNDLYQIFVDTVRASGGNNGKRALLINPYGANGEAPAMSALAAAIPNDPAKNKIIVSYHAYEPYNFALSTNKAFNTWDKNNSADTSAITSRLDRAYDIFVSEGIPVIMGEMGAMNKDNEDARAEWAEYYVKYAKGKGIPCVWWDNGSFTGSGELFGILNRSDNTFPYPKVVQALAKGSK